MQNGENGLKFLNYDYSQNAVDFFIDVLNEYKSFRLSGSNPRQFVLSYSNIIYELFKYETGKSGLAGIDYSVKVFDLLTDSDTALKAVTDLMKDLEKAFNEKYRDALDSIINVVPEDINIERDDFRYYDSTIGTVGYINSKNMDKELKNAFNVFFYSLVGRFIYGLNVLPLDYIKGFDWTAIDPTNSYPIFGETGDYVNKFLFPGYNLKSPKFLVKGVGNVTDFVSAMQISLDKIDVLIDNIVANKRRGFQYGNKIAIKKLADNVEDTNNSMLKALVSSDIELVTRRIIYRENGRDKIYNKNYKKIGVIIKDPDMQEILNDNQITIQMSLAPFISNKERPKLSTAQRYWYTIVFYIIGSGFNFAQYRRPSNRQYIKPSTLMRLSAMNDKDFLAIRSKIENIPPLDEQI